MRQKAGTMYREETNIPMIIAHPDFVGGRTTKGLMGAIDIAPTLMSLAGFSAADAASRSEEHTSELQSLMRISYAVFCLKKKKKDIPNNKYIMKTIHADL